MKSLRKAMCFTLAVGFATSFGCINAALAAQNQQNQTNQSPANLGKVTVTGTRIKRTQIEKAQPVLRISRKQIQDSGVANIGDLLQRISSAGSAFNRQFSFGGSGATHIDLRYLGSQRVLVLINGHRLVLGGNGGGTSIAAVPGLSGSADLSVIPTSIIDHIEVLQDGASAVYGSDAIAGVVNIITRKNYNGAEVSAYAGGYENHNFDGLTQKYSITYGLGSDRGNLTASLSYENSDPVESNSRTYSQPGVPGTGNLFKGAGFEGQYVFVDPAGNRQDLTLKNPLGSAHPTLNDLRPFGDNTRNSIGVPSTYDETPQNRLGVFLQGHYDISNHVRFNSTLIYSDRTSKQNEADQFVYDTVGIAPRVGQAPIVLSHLNSFSPFPYDLVASNNPAENNVATIIKSFPRSDSGGTWWVSEDSRLLQYIGGFSGDFVLADRDFSWDANFIYGNTDENSITHNSYNINHLRLALGPPAQCTAVPKCVPFNMFGPNTPAAAQYIFPTDQARDTLSERIYNADISSADILDLPGGPLGFALGFQHREQNGRIIPGALQSSGALDEPPVAPTAGQFDVNAIYGELNIPILANLPGVNALGADLQVRHSNYSTFGGNTSERLGLRYQPVNSLLIRATWSSGFRAPGIQDLFSGETANYLSLNDPCRAINFGKLSTSAQQRCVNAGVSQGGYTQINGQVYTLGGGNPNLQPETSISRTVGFVYSPDWLPGFNINADYFKIEVNNAIISLQAQDLVNACYLGGAQNFCNAITRSSVGRVAQLVNFPRNIARFNDNGFDVGVSYKFPTTPVGDFTLSLNESHMILYTETTPNFNGNGGFSTQQFVGTEPTGIDNRGFPDGMPANKANLALDWSSGNWSANYRVYYIQSTTGPCTGSTTTHTYQGVGLCTTTATNPLNATYRRPNQYYQDVQASYDFASINTTFRLGVNNLFDRKPPLLLDDPTLDRVPGRFLYAQITTKF